MLEAQACDYQGPSSSAVNECDRRVQVYQHYCSSRETERQSWWCWLGVWTGCTDSPRGVLSLLHRVTTQLRSLPSQSRSPATTLRSRGSTEGPRVLPQGSKRKRARRRQPAHQTQSLQSSRPRPTKSASHVNIHASSASCQFGRCAQWFVDSRMNRARKAGNKQRRKKRPSRQTDRQTDIHTDRHTDRHTSMRVLVSNAHIPLKQ